MKQILHKSLALKAFLFVASLIMGISGTWAAEESVTFSEKGYENGNAIETYQGSNFSITFDKGENTNPPKYYTTGAAIRLYGSNNFTVSSEYTITNIAFTFSTGEGTNPISANVGSYENNSWSGSANSVTFTIGGTTGHRRLASVTVTYSNSSSVATPSIIGTEIFLESTDVTIICATEGAAIQYSTNNGSTWTNYSAPFTINETTTVLAKATKSGMDDSGVATKTFTKPNIMTVAEARAAIDAETGTQNVYATGIVSAIPTAWSSKYNNITFNIVDQSDDSDFLQAFRCISTSSADASQVTVGDIVVVYGNLTKYNSTYEFAQECTLISLTHPEAAVETPSFSPAAGTYSDAQSVTINCETSGATIYYTTDGTDPTNASTQYNGAITVGTTTTIKAIAIKGADQSTIATATYHINSQASPYTVEQALAFKEYPANGVYVHGIVSTAPTLDPTNNGEMTYYISDNGEASNQLEVYKGKGLEQAAFNTQADIQVGDIVTIYGNIQVYNSTIEFATGNYLVAFERPGTPIVIPVPTFSPAAGEVEAGTTVAINVPSEEIVDYVEYSYDQVTWTEYKDETPFTINEETTIYARSVSTDGNYSDVVSAAYTIKSTPIAEDVVIVEDDKTTFLFNTKDNEWGLPAGTTNKTAEVATFTANGYSITMAGNDGNGYYYNPTDKYLILGKNGAYLTLPAFGFAVGKIVIEGNSSASPNVVQNIYVDDEAVSTATTGAKVSNSYVIAPNYQAAGNVYTLKVLSDHNTQITKIIVYKATGEEKADPQLRYSATTATATIGQDFTAPTLSYVEGFDGTITYTSDNEEVASVDAEGVVTLITAGTAVITASFAGNANYEAAEATYTLTVKNAAVIGTDKFKLVTDASALAAGDIIIIVGSYDTDEGSKAYALGTEQKTNNREAVAVTIESTDGTITPSSEVQQITLEEGWYFKVDNGYLYAASSSSNYLKTEEVIDEDDNAKAAISISDNNATILFQGTNKRNNLRFNYNNGTPLFACYTENTSTGSSPQIYRKVASETPAVEGDVNKDGKLTIADVTALVNIILGHPGEDVDMDAANVNGDEKVTIADVTALVNKILKQ